MTLKPRFVAALIIPLFASVPFAHAQAPGLQIGPSTTAELKGAATLFQLRIPFGGREQESMRPTVTLNAGPLYREQSDASYLRGKYFTTPSVQFGYSVDGDPIAKVGSTDLTKRDGRQRRLWRALLGFSQR